MLIKISKDFFIDLIDSGFPNLWAHSKDGV